MEISQNWRLASMLPQERSSLELAAVNLDDRFWMTAKVPGDVHSSLLQHGLIDNLYFGHNDLKSLWIEDKEWWYRTSFIYEKADEPAKYELIFEGLDTFATVYVNGLEIGKTSNMLMAYEFDVSRVLKNGKNVIAVKFDPITPHHQGKYQFEWSSYTKERPWLRKAAMNFGWDWGPRIVTTGIWGRVRIESRHVAKLDHVFARTVKLTENSAQVQIDTVIKPYSRKATFECEITITGRDKILVQQRTELAGIYGTEIIQLDNPSLWWTHDLGDPYMYELSVSLLADGQEVDVHRQSLGIRTIELEFLDQEGRQSFAFILNGVKLFAKGSNWIPADNLIGAIPESRYVDLIDMAVESNMNMLRVWAGGIYEKDVFYETCNQRGVLVWQDFAFANALFPDFNKDFMDNVRQEVIYNVKRLRNHPSLALWCGNNEIDWLYDMKSSEGSITTPFYGEAIYHELIPEVLAELDNSRAYWPSSPFGGNDANDPDVGDRHNWQVWHGSVYPRQQGDVPIIDYSIEGVTFKNYKQDYTLFSSEFGMHASANRYTLEKHIPSGQFYWNSSEMAYRNKDTNHQKGLLLMEGYTGIPQDIEEYMNFSMLTQAEGLKYGIEHYRRNKARTSGSLVWQHNDSWPGTSWSLIDYELLPKASWYYAKGFYHPNLLSLEHEPEQNLTVWAINDRGVSWTGPITLTVYHFSGKEYSRHIFHSLIPANGAVNLGSLTEEQALNGCPAEEAVVVLEAQGWGAPVNMYYLRDHKDLRLPEGEVLVECDPKEQTVTVTACSTLLRMIKLELPEGHLQFSDNYFDLLPGTSRKVTIKSRRGTPVHFAGLRVSALNSQNTFSVNEHN